MSRFYKALGFTIFLLTVDQIIKIWVKTNMMIGQDIQIIDDWFIIQFVENPGMAFGLTFGGDWGKLALSLFRIIAIGGIAWYLFDLARKNAPTIVMLCISLILAGAAGNMIDSAFYGLIFDSSHHQIATFMPEKSYGTFLHGNVVDMFAFPKVLSENFSLFRPIYNFADACITIAVVLIILNWKKFVKDEKQLSEEKSSIEEKAS